MKIPLVYMAGIISYSGGWFSHSRAPIGNIWHGPELKLVIPTTPYDAKGLLPLSKVLLEATLPTEEKIINAVKKTLA